jgi:hypothetical protein
MEQEIEALLKALLSEQQRERELYQSVLAAMSVAVCAKSRLVEDIITASKHAIGPDPSRASNRRGAVVAQDLLDQAVKNIARSRDSMFANSLN